MTPLKLLMIGAGGIGGYYAARLAQAGHSLVLTARGEHLTAIRAGGLQVDYQGQHLACDAPVFDHASLVQHHQPDDFDLIIVALKSTATHPVLDELGAWLAGGQAPVLSLQNGVDNEPLIAGVVGEKRTLGGLAVRIGGHITEPGHVFAEGVAQVVMGAWPRNPEADGVNLSQRDLDEMFELIRSFNAIKTSMLVDREKGRPLELDSIAGAVLRRLPDPETDAPYTFLVQAILSQG